MENPTFSERALDEGERGRWWLAQFLQRRRVVVLRTPQFGQATGLLADDDHLPAPGLRGVDMLQHQLELSAKVGTGNKAGGQARSCTLPPVAQREHKLVGQSF